MENNEKITHGQISFLTYAAAAGNIVYTFTFVTYVTGRPFWVAVLIGVLLNIPFAIWILHLGKYRQGGTIFDILETGLGKIICKFVIIIYLLINIAIAASMLNMITGTIKVYFLPKTPAFIIIFIIVFICTLFVNSGIQIFGKLIQILAVLCTVNYFLGFFPSFFSIFKIENVLPIFDASFVDFAKGVMITAGTVSECLLFLMVMISSISEPQKQYLSIIKGLTMWSIVLSFAILIMEGNIGHELLSGVAQAGVTVSSLIEIKSFIRGLEILVFMTYQYIAVFKTVIFIYSCQESFKKLFNIKKGMLFLILAALLIFVSSIFINSFNTSYYLAVFLGSYVILPFVILVLILASFSVVIIRKRNGESLK